MTRRRDRGIWALMQFRIQTDISVSARRNFIKFSYNIFQIIRITHINFSQIGVVVVHCLECLPCFYFCNAQYMLRVSCDYSSVCTHTQICTCAGLGLGLGHAGLGKPDLDLDLDTSLLIPPPPLVKKDY